MRETQDVCEKRTNLGGEGQEGKKTTGRTCRSWSLFTPSAPSNHTVRQYRSRKAGKTRWSMASLLWGRRYGGRKGVISERNNRRREGGREGGLLHIYIPKDDHPVHQGRNDMRALVEEGLEDEFPTVSFLPIHAYVHR